MLNFRWITCLLYFAAWMLVKTPSLSHPLELVQCTLFSLCPEQDYVFPFFLETCCNSAYIKTKHTSYPFLDKTFFRQNPLLALFHPCLAGKDESRPAVESSYAGSRCWTCDRVESSCQAQDHLLLQVELLLYYLLHVEFLKLINDQLLAN